MLGASKYIALVALLCAVSSAYAYTALPEIDISAAAWTLKPKPKAFIFDPTQVNKNVLTTSRADKRQVFYAWKTPRENVINMCKNIADLTNFSKRAEWMRQFGYYITEEGQTVAASGYLNVLATNKICKQEEITSEEKIQLSVQLSSTARRFIISCPGAQLGCSIWRVGDTSLKKGANNNAGRRRALKADGIQTEGRALKVNVDYDYDYEDTDYLQVDYDYDYDYDTDDDGNTTCDVAGASCDYDSDCCSEYCVVWQIGKLRSGCRPRDNAVQ